VRPGRKGKAKGKVQKAKVKGRLLKNPGYENKKLRQWATAGHALHYGRRRGAVT
jgi:hypothetical protein